MYVFEQLYFTIEAMTDEQFAERREVYGDLKKGMPYADFVKIVQEVTMTKMWSKGLRVNLEDTDKAVKATTVGVRSENFSANPSASEWWLLLNNWIHMINP